MRRRWPRVARLVHRHRFPGDGRFLPSSSTLRLRASITRRSPGTRSPGFDQNDVTRTSSLASTGGSSTVAQHRGMRREHFLDRVHRGFRTPLLQKTDDGIAEDTATMTPLSIQCC